MLGALSRLRRYPERSRRLYLYEASGGASSAMTLQIMSQGLEKGEQFRRGLPLPGTSWSEACPLPECVEYLAFHLQVRGDVAAGCADRGVAKVVANHRHIDARL